MAALTGHITVGTWNLHEGLPELEAGSWAAKSSGSKGWRYPETSRRSVVDTINDLALDVVGLQEVSFRTGEMSPVLNDIMSETSLKHVAAYPLSPSSFFEDAYAGVALASRFPLRQIRRDRFPNPDLTRDVLDVHLESHDKGLVSAVASIAGSEVSFAALHMLPFHIFSRSAEDDLFHHIWQELSTRLQALAARPLIVLGDFNTDRRDLVTHTSPGLRSAVAKAPTYRDKSVDDILFSRDFKVSTMNTLANFSDHTLCVAELQIP